MNCPVCGKEAVAHIYHCARCAVYVHVKCWPSHVQQAHPAPGSGRAPAKAGRKNR